MTTMVKVRASSHDVEVRRVNPKDGADIMPVEVVPKGDEYVFYAHQGQDIKVSEVRDD